MRFFRRRQDQVLETCPRCSQMVDRTQTDCPMCGNDLREAYQRPVVSESRTRHDEEKSASR